MRLKEGAVEKNANADCTKPSFGVRHVCSTKPSGISPCMSSRATKIALVYLQMTKLLKTCALFACIAGIAVGVAVAASRRRESSTESSSCIFLDPISWCELYPLESTLATWIRIATKNLFFPRAVEAQYIRIVMYNCSRKGKNPIVAWVRLPFGSANYPVVRKSGCPSTLRQRNRKYSADAANAYNSHKRPL